MIDLRGLNAVFLYSNESSQVPKGEKSNLLAQPSPQEPEGLSVWFLSSPEASAGPLEHCYFPVNILCVYRDVIRQICIIFFLMRHFKRFTCYICICGGGYVAVGLCFVFCFFRIRFSILREYNVLLRMKDFSFENAKHIFKKHLIILRSGSSCLRC